MAPKAGFKLDFSQVDGNVEKLKSKFEGAMKILCDNGAQKMEAYAKQNRPWKDQTGEARRRLKGSWSKEGSSYKIQIAHGVSYGVWLEFKNERRYAILKPTVEKVGYKEIIPAFENFVGKLKL